MAVFHKKSVQISLLAGALLVAAAVCCGLWVRQWLISPVSVPDEYRTLTVQQGDSLAAVANRLSQKKLLGYPVVWRQYAKYFDAEPIKAGEYELAAQESPASLLNLLQSGEVKTYNITLVEGKTFNDFVETLASHDKLAAHLSLLTWQEQRDMLDLSIAHPEGWFYPDTYQFHLGDSDVGILRRAYQKMVSVLGREWDNRDTQLPYKTPYEVLIMASIVEKETGVGYERAEIAGVFVRRLLQGMRLQTDPTVIYGLGAEYQGNIKRKHLRQPTPYNTYVIKGLPPTPIAMPGGDAIHAALNPAAGEALYFVAKGDGTHYFSATLDEHNQAVDRYQRRRRTKEYRSSPPTN